MHGYICMAICSIHIHIYAFLVNKNHIKIFDTIFYFVTKIQISNDHRLYLFFKSGKDNKPFISLRIEYVWIGRGSSHL